jgi:calcineurin-like phosphoesterase family protein
MGHTFVTADPHFSHWGVCKFLRDDGTKLRPWDNPDEMDEALVTYWNETVRPKDTVYVLGDFCINRRGLQNAGKLNGRKILVKGNHDVFRLEEYSQYFQDVRACVVLQRAILTHIPVHPSQLDRFHHNVHGHMHSHRVMRDEWWRSDKPDAVGVDPRYTCVSVEHTEFKPILLSTVLENIQ